VKRRRSATVRIPRDLHERVAAEAERLGYPAPWLLARIIREGLDHLPERITLTDHPEPPPFNPDPDLIGRIEEGQ